jgi:ppGpp synthetase/RelA/SpoT-type nucleotidyltranferase
MKNIFQSGNKEIEGTYRRILIRNYNSVMKLLESFIKRGCINPNGKELKKLRAEYETAFTNEKGETVYPPIAQKVESPYIPPILWKLAEITEIASVSRRKPIQDSLKGVVEDFMSKTGSKVKLDIRTKTRETIFAKLCKNFVAGGDARKSIINAPIDKTVRDTTGARFILAEPDEENIVLFLNLLRQKGIKIKAFANYVTPGCPPYVSIDKLLEAVPEVKTYRPSDESKIWYSLSQADEAGASVPGYIHQKSSNYSSLHLNLELPDGTPLELQIRGKRMHSVAQAEHAIYDIKQNKPGGKIFEEVKRVYNALRANDTLYTQTDETLHPEIVKYIEKIIEERKFVARNIDNKTEAEIAADPKMRDDAPVKLVDIYTQYLKELYRYERLCEINPAPGNREVPFPLEYIEVPGLTDDELLCLNYQNLQKLVKEIEKSYAQKSLSLVTGPLEYWKTVLNRARRVFEGRTNGSSKKRNNEKISGRNKRRMSSMKSRRPIFSTQVRKRNKTGKLSISG